MQRLNALFSGINTVLLGCLLYAVCHPLVTKDLGSPNMTEDQEFSWERYEDPVHVEFWDNGFYNGVPPRPMRFVAKYPSEENFARLERWKHKRQLLALANGSGLAQAKLSAAVSPQDQKADFLKKTAPSDEIYVPWKGLEMIYIYHSQCSACKANKALLTDLEKEGVKITYLQIDQGHKPLHKGSLPYTAEYKNFFPASITPSYYIKLSENRVFAASGSMNKEELKVRINSFLLKDRKNHAD